MVERLPSMCEALSLTQGADVPRGEKSMETVPKGSGKCDMHRGCHETTARR